MLQKHSDLTAPERASLSMPRSMRAGRSVGKPKPNTHTTMKREQRRQSLSYKETVRDRFPGASRAFIQRLINIQDGKEKP